MRFAEFLTALRTPAPFAAGQIGNDTIAGTVNEHPAFYGDLCLCARHPHGHRGDVPLRVFVHSGDRGV
ncbi:hypothetical protein D3C76_502050 [compost metagenome]